MNSIKNLAKALIILNFFQTYLVHAKRSDEENPEPNPIGNFALAGSQQPGPFISFGENILDQGSFQLILGSTLYFGKNNFTANGYPSLVYGITDETSILFSLPFSFYTQENSAHSAGLLDAAVQFEYAYLNRNTKTSNDLATIVGNVTFPTGSTNVNPSLGLGASSIFLGATYNHTEIYWFFFLSPGVIITTNWLGESTSGNSFLYQGGFGRNITSSAKWMSWWVVEIDGIYTQNAENTPFDSNIIYVNPSVAFATPKMILQVGAGYPIVQSIPPSEPKQFLAINGAVIFTF